MQHMVSFDQARGLVFYSFSNQMLLEGFLYGTTKTGMSYILDIYVKSMVMPCLSRTCCS